MHAGRRGGDDVVVDPITEVCDKVRLCASHQLQGPLEERRIGLVHAHLAGHRHHVGLEAQGAQLRGAARRLVGEDRDPVASGAELLHGRQGVGVAVIGLEATVEILGAGHQLTPMRRSDDLERGPMVPPGSDLGAESGHQRQPGNAQQVCPHRPDPRLIDERLAHVECDPARFHERLA